MSLLRRRWRSLTQAERFADASVSDSVELELRSCVRVEFCASAYRPNPSNHRRRRSAAGHPGKLLCASIQCRIVSSGDIFEIS
jgi:hypothetical protein